MISWDLSTAMNAMQEHEPTQYICEGLFSLPSLSILYGPPGSLKSLLLMDLSVCIASGTKWLMWPNNDISGRYVIQSPVLWIDFDNGQRRVSERFAALLKSRKLPASVPLYYVSMVSPWLDMSSDKQTVDLAELINQKQVKFVVIDNLGVVSGGVEETSSSMIQVMSNFRLLTELTGAAIVIIHHQRKSRKDDDKMREGDKLRGHSSIEAALDLALMVYRKDQSEKITIRSTKTRDVDVPDFTATWSCTHKPGTVELDTAIFWGTGNVMGIEQAIMYSLQNGVMLNQKTLVALVLSLSNSSERQVLRTIAEMGAKQKLFTKKGDKNATFYFI